MIASLATCRPESRRRALVSRRGEGSAPLLLRFSIDPFSNNPGIAARGCLSGAGPSASLRPEQHPRIAPAHFPFKNPSNTSIYFPGSSYAGRCPLCSKKTIFAPGMACASRQAVSGATFMS
jgi:hypothetical protein